MRSCAYAMEIIALQRVIDCLENKRESLKLGGLQLIELPELPPHIIYLQCPMNRLTYLPNILPPNLQRLLISINQIEKLPKIPITLSVLYCCSNQIRELPDLSSCVNLVELNVSANFIKELPNLPDSLKVLSVANNKLIKITKLPPNLQRIDIGINKLVKISCLPATLRDLYSYHNDFLHFSDDIRARFNIERKPNIGLHIYLLKKILAARNRQKRLQFCTRIEDSAEEFRYRPDGDGYIELKKTYKNKKIFFDL
jgi:Leucine-rich repeat (LRR) protein